MEVMKFRKVDGHTSQASDVLGNCRVLNGSGWREAPCTVFFTCLSSSTHYGNLSQPVWQRIPGVRRSYREGPEIQKITVKLLFLLAQAKQCHTRRELTLNAASAPAEAGEANGEQLLWFDDLQMSLGWQSMPPSRRRVWNTEKMSILILDFYFFPGLRESSNTRDANRWWKHLAVWIKIRFAGWCPPAIPTLEKLKHPGFKTKQRSGAMMVQWVGALAVQARKPEFASWHPCTNTRYGCCARNAITGSDRGSLELGGCWRPPSF